MTTGKHRAPARERGALTSQGASHVKAMVELAGSLNTQSR
jgi:hypothetical protein